MAAWHRFPRGSIADDEPGSIYSAGFPSLLHKAQDSLSALGGLRLPEDPDDVVGHLERDPSPKLLGREHLE